MSPNTLVAYIITHKISCKENSRVNQDDWATVFLDWFTTYICETQSTHDVVEDTYILGVT